jgi:hypothetical protein
MEYGWAVAAQAAITAISTVVIRLASKKDVQKTIAGTASQTTSDEIRDDVKTMKLDIALLKAREIERNGPMKPDDRKPEGE